MKRLLTLLMLTPIFLAAFAVSTPASAGASVYRDCSDVLNEKDRKLLQQEPSSTESNQNIAPDNSSYQGSSSTIYLRNGDGSSGIINTVPTAQDCESRRQELINSGKLSPFSQYRYIAMAFILLLIATITLLIIIVARKRTSVAVKPDQVPQFVLWVLCIPIGLIALYTVAQLGFIAKEFFRIGYSPVYYYSDFILFVTSLEAFLITTTFAAPHHKKLVSIILGTISYAVITYIYLSSSANYYTGDYSLETIFLLLIYLIVCSAPYFMLLLLKKYRYKKIL